MTILWADDANGNMLEWHFRYPGSNPGRSTNLTLTETTGDSQ